MAARSMNLMDLLSSESNVIEPEPDYNGSSTFYANPSEISDVTPKQEPNSSMVYYLPTELTQLQKDMSEATIHMFTSKLQSELLPKTSGSNINSLLLAPDDAVNGSHTSETQKRARVISLIYNQLLTICMHPSLVVDHFISKGLLLLSTKLRLFNLSGKLKLFDEIIDLIADRYEVKSPSQDYNLLVIAKSIKELELIEGSVIGKKLRYRNVSSGKSLYEEPEEPTRLEKDEFPDEEHSAEYKQRHQHFAARQAGKDRSMSKSFQVHLITSNHLCQSFSSDSKFDLMISFDSGIDISNPSVDLLRRNPYFDASLDTQVHTPMFIPVPVYSIEHILAVIPKAESELGSLSSDSDANWRRKVLSVFVANRYQIFGNLNENVFGVNYGNGFSHLLNLIFHRDKAVSYSKFKWLDIYTNKMSFETTGDKLKARLEANYLLSLSGVFSDYASGWEPSGYEKFQDQHVEDYEGFKRQMARFLYLRAGQVEALKKDALKHIIPNLREKEANRQKEIDDDEDNVGDNYRKLRKLNDQIASIDKRFNRVENENQKLQDSVNEAQQLVDNLQDSLKKKSVDEVDQNSTKEIAILNELEKEKSALSEECRTVSEEIEVTRDEYQQKSSEALRLTEKLQELKDKQFNLKKKLEGPGMSILPSLARKEEISAYEARIRRLTEESRFLNGLFTLRLDKVVKERSFAMESAASPSNSRQNNRTSRAPTPL